MKGDPMIRAIAIVAILFAGNISVFAGMVESNQEKGCTRAALQEAVDSYMAAQEEGDLSKMLFASKVKYIEDMEETAREDGLWNTPLSIEFHRSFLDTDLCRTFTEVIVTRGEHPYVFGIRLTVGNGKITEMESLVTDEDDWLFNADNYLKYTQAEDWRVLDPGERVSRQALMDAGNAYFDHFADRTVQIPFGAPCARLEGGIYTTRDFDDPSNRCNVGFPVDKLPIVDRSYVVDEEMGTVNIFCRFGNPPGAPDSHTFRLVNGKLRYIHTLTLTVPGVSSEQIMGSQPKSKPKN